MLHGGAIKIAEAFSWLQICTAHTVLVWVVQVTILVAILFLVLGSLRLGFLCNMLSKPIISAFLTAGAIIISTSQVLPLIFCRPLPFPAQLTS